MSETTLMTPTDLVGKCLKDLPVWAREVWVDIPGCDRFPFPYYFTNPTARLLPPDTRDFVVKQLPSDAELPVLEFSSSLCTYEEAKFEIADPGTQSRMTRRDGWFAPNPVMLSTTAGVRVIDIMDGPLKKVPGKDYWVTDLSDPRLNRLLNQLPHAIGDSWEEPSFVFVFIPDVLPAGLYNIGGIEVEVWDRPAFSPFFPFDDYQVKDRPLVSIHDVARVTRLRDLLTPEERRARWSNETPRQAPRRVAPRRFDQTDVIDVPVKVEDPIRLNFASAGDFLDKSYMQWRVQDFLPATGVAMIYGASQSGKTLLGIDLAGAVLNGRAWLGQPTEKAPVAYAALEGPEGFRDRVKAYAKHHGKNSLADLKVLDKTFSLTDRDHLDVLIRQLRAIGYREGIFIIDTLSVVAHGDLNQNSFGSEVYRACKRIVDAVGGLVLLVHHTGKDEDKGAKGASSITQHIDTILKVEDRRGMRAVKIEKQRDGDTSQKLRFAVKPVAIGQDDRGKTVTSVIAVEDHYGKVVLRGHNQDALDILDDLVETVGRTPDELQLRDKVGLSEGTRLITKDEWKNAFLDAVRTTTDKQKEARRRAFDRAFSALGDLGFYGFHGEFIYLKK